MTSTEMPTARRRAWPAVVMGIVALGAAVALVFPYVLLDIDASRIETTSRLHYGLLVAHIFTASVALVLGPLQFVAAVRARRAVHRAIGRCYLLVGVLPSALVGVPVAILSDRPLTQVGLTIPFLGWLATGWLGWRAIRRGDVAAHREWMMRNYALTFLAVTARVLVPLMLLVQIPFAGTGGPATEAGMLVPVGQVLAWVLNLAVVEVMIRRGRAHHRRSEAASHG